MSLTSLSSLVQSLWHGILTEGEGRISKDDLFVLTSPDKLLLILKIFFSSYLNEDVNSAKPSPSVSVPCLWVRPGAYPRVDHLKGASLG